MVLYLMHQPHFITVLLLVAIFFWGRGGEKKENRDIYEVEKYFTMTRSVNILYNVSDSICDRN